MSESEKCKEKGWLSPSYERHLALISDFVAREGHACVPVAHIEQGVFLGRWVAAQRSKKRAGLLDATQIEALEALPHWAWKASDFQWDVGIERLGQFVAREGHCRVPSNYIENRFKLGDWLLRQRKRFRLNRLTQTQVDELLAFGFDAQAWRTTRPRKSWEARFKLLSEYAKREGTSVVPRSHKEGDFTLGVWVNSLRSQYSNGSLDPKLAARLEALPHWRWAKPRKARKI